MVDNKILDFFNYLLSVRRIFHITADFDYNAERVFTDTQFSFYGSCILIKIQRKFFILTARHVLKDYIELPLPNTSPFRIQLEIDRGFNNTNDFMYPLILWDIGKSNDSQTNYESNDIVLVEMSALLPFQKIRNYIDLNEIKIIDIKDFKEDLPVFDSGFSILSNPFFYESDNDVAPFDEKEFTHSTIVKRDLVYGILKQDKDIFYVKKNKHSIKDTNGMSGGLITTIHEGIPKILGMHIAGHVNSDRINFIPFSLILPAIKSYIYSPKYIIDYEYFKRFQSGNLKSIFEIMDQELASKVFNLGLANNEQNDEEVVFQFFKFLHEYQDFFLANYEFIDELNGNTKRTDNFKDILKIIDNKDI